MVSAGHDAADQDADEGAERVAAALPGALAQRSAQAVGDLLAPDVRWGALEDDEETCHGRAEVLAFYAGLLEEGAALDVRDVQVDGGRIRLVVRVGSSSGDGFDQPTVITVRGGLIVDVLHPDA